MNPADPARTRSSHGPAALLGSEYASSPVLSFRTLSPVLGLLLVLLVAASARVHNLTDVLIGGRIYFVDADCYSRMSRAQIISEAPGKIIRHQDFENWPEGVDSHATAPLDYGIVVLDRMLRLVWPNEGRLGVLSGSTLDLAGALISPLLGVVLCGFLWFWSRGLRLSGGAPLPAWWAVPLIAAVSPALVHASLLGRPDHQSLLVLLLAVVLAAEQRQQQQSSSGWAWAGGLSSGLALWVSLYEPLVLLGALLIGGTILWRGVWLTRARAHWLVALLLPVAAGVLLEGIRVVLPDPRWGDMLRNWGGTIGELQVLADPAALTKWTGLLFWLIPLAALSRTRAEVARFLGWFLLLLLTASLTYWQIRWSPYFVLVFLCCLPFLLARFRTHGMGALAVLLSLWPMGVDWKTRLQPDSGTVEQHHFDRSERLNARLAAERMRSPERLPFIAAWWLSPSLAYWSQQPAVAGSGHEGIAGIVDTARFFLSTDPVEGREILHRRGVRLVVASDSARVVENSSAILNQVPKEKPIAEQLWGSNLELDWGLEGETNVTTFRILKVKE